MSIKKKKTMSKNKKNSAINVGERAAVGHGSALCPGRSGLAQEPVALEQQPECCGRTALIQGGGKIPVKIRMSSGTWSRPQQLSGQELVLVPCHALAAAPTAAPCPSPPPRYPRKVEMKTLVSRLSVACHQRSGKYRTCRERAGKGSPGSPAGCCCLPCTLPKGTHLPRAEGALERVLSWWQRRVCVLEPG